MRFKTTVGVVLASLAFVFFASAESPRSVPTNSLAFHLQSLARVPSTEEREVIESALRLMQRYSIRSDYPLRSVSRDTARSEWVLVFDSRHPDAGFELFLTRKDASYVEVHWAGTSWRTRYPAETKKKR
jgi:hypothetical protein